MVQLGNIFIHNVNANLLKKNEFKEIKIPLQVLFFNVTSGQVHILTEEWEK